MVPFPLNAQNIKSKKETDYTDHNRCNIERAQNTMICWDYAFRRNALKLL